VLQLVVVYLRRRESLNALLVMVLALVLVLVLVLL
jgi:hypothetical protein